MKQFHGEPSVVVVGAGAAGIGAGREFTRRGIPHVILEARDRVGGRAWTNPSGTPYPLDLGCEWLHSADRNVLAELAPALGFTIDRSLPPWRHRHPQRGFGDAEQDAFGVEQAAFYARLAHAAAEARSIGADRPAGDLLDPEARWNGFIDAISTYYNGAPLDRVSVVDFDSYVDTEENWRVVEGYGALIAAAGGALPVCLDRKVTRIDATGRAVKVETTAGTIATDVVIVTVPTSVLAAGAIVFDPPLDNHLDAAAHLPLGVANKIFLRLEGAEDFEPDTRLIGAPERADTGSYTLRGRGRSLVEGYFGGDYARRLERGGLPAFTAAARDEITSAFGRNIGARMAPIVATRWASDPLSLGSYSHALPGHASARAVLATPADGRIIFAGEATSPHFFSTAHGAFEEGVRAARLVGRKR